MNNPDSKKPSSTAPAASGNPAYPSLQAREEIIAENKKHPDEAVKKIPADKLKEHDAATGKAR